MPVVDPPVVNVFTSTFSQVCLQLLTMIPVTLLTAQSDSAPKNDLNLWGAGRKAKWTGYITHLEWTSKKYNPVD